MPNGLAPFIDYPTINISFNTSFYQINNLFFVNTSNETAITGEQLSEQIAARNNLGYGVGRFLRRFTHTALPPSTYVKQQKGLPFTTNTNQESEHSNATYQITNCTQLQNMAGDLSGNYVLVNDIDCYDTSKWNNGSGFIPVGNETTKFTGSLLGNKYKIFNLYMNPSNKTYVGLFGDTIGVIANVQLTNITIHANWMTGAKMVGALAGINEGNITDVSISFCTINTDAQVGGLAAINYGSIWNSFVTGANTLVGSQVGGLTATNYGDVRACYTTGRMSQLGGIVGGLVSINYANVNNSYVTGNVTAGGEGAGSIAGGLVGINKANISNCYATGNVRAGGGAGGPTAGGLVGVNEANVLSCYATGNSEAGGGGGGPLAGGLIGDNDVDANVRDSYATGSVTSGGGGGGPLAGGLAGSNRGDITNSYATGNVFSDTAGGAGGLVGVNRANVSNCYATGSVTAVGGNGAPLAGGLIGDNDVDANVKDSYATGSVTSSRRGESGSPLAGGLVGSNRGNISNSYAVGNVVSDQAGGAGGLVGNNYAIDETVIISSYYDTNTTHQIDVGKGVLKTTLQMRQYESFADWDFGATWKIEQDCSYPTLMWQNSPRFTIQFTPINSPQRVNTPFNISLYTNNQRSFNANITFYSERGQIMPQSVWLLNGTWTGEVMLYEVGINNRLEVRWFSEFGFCSDINFSNLFDVVEVNGDLPSNATLIGTVFDENGNAVPNATVTLYSDHPDKGGESLGVNTTTDRSGNYAIQKLMPRKYHLQFQKQGYQTSVNSVETAVNRNISGNGVLGSNCSELGSDKVSVPVLLVPGIMGSTEKTIWFTVIPELPKHSPSWDSDKLELLDPLTKVGWSDLETELLHNGYCKEPIFQTIFEVPYDWSLPIPQIRDKYLIPWIDEAKKKAKSTQVDIVAHSMGGLVARSYIQSLQYRNDIRRLILVATPSKGSDNVYFIWEGGDPIKADQLIPASWPTNFFYSETLNKLWKVRGKKCKHDQDELCDIDFEDCDNVRTYFFVHSTVQSAGQLMPTYKDALVERQTGLPRQIVYEENTLLKALNGEDCLNNPTKKCLNADGELYQFVPPASVFSADSSKVQTWLLYSTHEDRTVSQIAVIGDPDPNRLLYKDGWDSTTIRDVGDGTVIPSSVIFNDYFPPGQELPTIKISKAIHSNIISLSTKKIAQILTQGKITVYDDFATVTSTNNTFALAVTIDGRVQVSFTNPGNVSFKAAITLEQSQIVLTNVSNAVYTFPLKSIYQESYALEVTYYNGNDPATVMETIGYYDNSLNYIQITVDPSNVTSPLQYDRVFETPTNLQIFNTSSQFVALSWQDSFGDQQKDVRYYAVYWRLYDDPYLHYLGETADNEKTFQTKHTWEEAETNFYHVRSFLQNNRSTFFSAAPRLNTSENTLQFYPAHKEKTSSSGMVLSRIGVFNRRSDDLHVSKASLVDHQEPKRVAIKIIP